MWNTFIPDLVVATFGAALTVIIAFTTYIIKVRYDERLALQALIDELHQRRAVAPGPEPTIPNAAELGDFDRANRSVISMREEIRRTRDRVRQVPALRDPLSEMTRACNHYLELSEGTPPRYAQLLGRLRDDLDAQIRRLSAVKRGLTPLTPGMKAF